jgi:hypothetical protein
MSSSTDAQDHADIEKGKPLDPHIHDGHWDALPGDPLRSHHLRNLHIFQDLIGIRTHAHILRPGLSVAEAATLRTNTLESEGGPSSASLDDELFGRPKRKPIWKLFYNSRPSVGGYYRRAIDEQQSASYWFTISSILINLIYIIQILTAATITGLASYQNTTRTTLTVLGALNTVLAGLMAYLKGQGLPNRLLRSREQFSKVMEYAEYKERQFSHYASMLPSEKAAMDPWGEADRVRDLFVAAKKDQQENYPDTYLNNNERSAMQGIQMKDRLGFTKDEMQKLAEHGEAMRSDRGKGGGNGDSSG